MDEPAISLFGFSQIPKLFQITKMRCKYPNIASAFSV